MIEDYPETRNFRLRTTLQKKIPQVFNIFSHILEVFQSEGWRAVHKIMVPLLYELHDQGLYQHMCRRNRSCSCMIAAQVVQRYHAIHGSGMFHNSDAKYGCPVYRARSCDGVDPDDAG
jgi:hypothetical protein